MSKVFLIVTDSDWRVSRAGNRSTGWLLRGVCVVCCVLFSVFCGPRALAQPPAEEAKSDRKTEYLYPIAVAVVPGESVEQDVLFVVDLELPGIWRVTNDERKIFYRGSRRFRDVMNRPRCIATHPDGGVLVGDSASREVYHISGSDQEPVPLSGGRIGIPMAIAVSPDGKSVYVADAERKAVVQLQIGKSADEQSVSWVARVNARGLAFQNESSLIAVTPGPASLKKVDVSMPFAARPDKIVDNPAVTEILDKRVFEYPNGLAVHGDNLYVSDGYAHVIHLIEPDGKHRAWYTGKPLVGPVGITASNQAIWVTDPKTRSIMAFSLDSDPKLLQTR